ncbi:coatomer subunit zeta-1 [Alligator sinensis]|uniref:Coatomer subunit zeta n=1 Tax=Alligator sinensis TaxID=38654 RepID=A0A3Q0FI59_ALLSI|nr:coatomer subunit zeta-1 [Alligator sinensis]
MSESGCRGLDLPGQPQGDGGHPLGGGRAGTDGAMSPQDPSLYTVKAILILDNDGDRLFAKYYDDTYPSVKEQKAFEKNIFNKTHRTDSTACARLTPVPPRPQYYDDTYPSVKEQKAFEKNIFNKTHRTDSTPGSSRVLLMPGPVPALLGQLGWGLLKPDRDHLGQVRGPGQAAKGPAVPPSLPRPSEHLWVPRKNVEKRALLENMEGLFLAVDEIVDGGVILESDPQQVVHRVAVRGDDVPLTEQTVSQVLQSAKEQIKWSLLR